MTWNPPPPSKSRRAARLLALLSLAVLAPVAQAGHYQAGTTSGLTATFAGVGHAYPPTYGGGSASASAPGSNGAGSISGTLSTTFTWVPDYAGDTAPTNVIVSETCDVEADAKKYAGGSPTATASNGLDARFSTNASGSGPYGANGVDASASSSGTAPHVQAGGSAVTVNDCGPSGQTSTSNGPSTLTLTYSVTVTPVTITFSGPVNPQSSPQLAIGQLLTATVSGSLPDATYTWSTPSSGEPFSNYVASGTSAVYTSFTTPPTSSGSLSCYFGEPASTVTISCTIHSASLGASATATKTLAVVAPSFSSPSGPSFGAMALIYGSDENPIAFYLDIPGGVTVSGASTASRAGIYVPYTVTDPGILTAGSGVFGCVQIKDATQTTTVGNPNTASPVTSHTTGLDSGFPYHNLVVRNGQTVPDSNWVPADGSSPFNFMDEPGINAGGPFQTPSNGSYSGDFKTYLMYKPADDAAGGSVFVPLSLLNWTAVGHFIGPQPGIFSGTDDGSSLTNATVYPIFPIWP